MKKRKKLQRFGVRAAFCGFVGLLIFLGVWNQKVSVVATQGVPVPILMYHSVGYNNKVHSPYLLSPEDFESDLIWLRDHGYTAVFLSDLIRYSDGEGSLPEKPVVLTLDDGYLNNLTYVLPLLEQYDMKAVVSVVGSYCDDASARNDPNPAYAYLTWSDVETLVRSGRVEIGNHTYDMHALGKRKGCMRRKDESAAEYTATLGEDLSRLQNRLAELIGAAPEIFVYPYGAVSPEAESVLRSIGFRAALTCTERVNFLEIGSSDSLFCLGRFHRPSGESSEAFMSRVFGTI